jgi:large subunit ribosomal protein L18e
MISKTKLSKRTENKTNPELVETLILCKKNEKWMNIGKIISGPRRKRICMNLNEIDKEAKTGEIVLIPGKVLSQGDITKKIKIIAFNFSESAKEKLDKDKIEFKTMIEEIKLNPKAEKIRVLKK